MLDIKNKVANYQSESYGAKTPTTDHSTNAQCKNVKTTTHIIPFSTVTHHYFTLLSDAIDGYK